MITRVKDVYDVIWDVNIVLFAIPVVGMLVLSHKCGFVNLYRRCFNFLLKMKAVQTPKSSPWLVDNHLITNKLAISVKKFKEKPSESTSK